MNNAARVSTCLTEGLGCGRDAGCGEKIAIQVPVFAEVKWDNLWKVPSQERGLILNPGRHQFLKNGMELIRFQLPLPPEGKVRLRRVPSGPSPSVIPRQ